MSMPIKTHLDKFLAASVAFVLCVASALALWLAFSEKVASRVQVPKAPQLSFTFPAITTSADAASPLPLISRDPFRKDTVPQNTPKIQADTSDLTEIQLSMISTTAKRQSCITNGKFMTAGQSNGVFSIKEITEQGVWYSTPKEQFFVKVGDKVAVKSDGTVHRTQETPRNENIYERN